MSSTDSLRHRDALVIRQLGTVRSTFAEDLLWYRPSWTRAGEWMGPGRQREGEEIIKNHWLPNISEFTHQVEKSRLCCFEQLGTDGGRQQTQQISDERTIKVGNFVQMAGRWYAGFGRAKQRSLVRIVAKDETEQKSRHDNVPQAEHRKVAIVVDRRKNQLAGQTQFGCLVVGIAHSVQMQSFAEQSDRVFGRSCGHLDHHIRTEDVGREEDPENVVDEQTGEQKGGHLQTGQTDESDEGHTQTHAHGWRVMTEEEKRMGKIISWICLTYKIRLLSGVRVARIDLESWKMIFALENWNTTRGRSKCGSV